MHMCICIIHSFIHVCACNVRRGTRAQAYMHTVYMHQPTCVQCKCAVRHGAVHESVCAQHTRVYTGVPSVRAQAYVPTLHMHQPTCIQCKCAFETPYLFELSLLWGFEHGYMQQLEAPHACACARACVRARSFAHWCIFIHPCAQGFWRVCARARMHARACARVRVCACARMSVCMRIYVLPLQVCAFLRGVCVCMHVYAFP